MRYGSVHPRPSFTTPPTLIIAIYSYSSMIFVWSYYIVYYNNTDYRWIISMCLKLDRNNGEQ